MFIIIIILYHIPCHCTLKCLKNFLLYFGSCTFSLTPHSRIKLRAARHARADSAYQENHREPIQRKNMEKQNEELNESTESTVYSLKKEEKFEMFEMFEHSDTFWSFCLFLSIFVLHSEYFPVLIAHAFNHWAVRAVPKVRKAAASIGVGFIRRLATKDPLNGEFLYLTWSTYWATKRNWQFLKHSTGLSLGFSICFHWSAGCIAACIAQSLHEMVPFREMFLSARDPNIPNQQSCGLNWSSPLVQSDVSPSLMSLPGWPDAKFSSATGCPPHRWHCTSRRDS